MSKATELAMKAAAMIQHAMDDAPPDGALPAGIEPLGGQRPTPDGSTLSWIEVVLPAGTPFHVENTSGGEVRVGRVRTMPDGTIRLRLPFPGALPPEVADRYPELTNGHPAGEQGTTRRRVFEALIAAHRAGEIGLSDEVLAARTGLGVHPVNGRRSELLQRGWIEEAPERGVTAKGKSCKQWRLSPAALEWLKEQ